jgi:hypothetical protein
VRLDSVRFPALFAIEVLKVKEVFQKHRDWWKWAAAVIV